jgi:hypothetical protein
MSDPLSETDKDLLAHAAELHRPLARAAKVAHTNGGWLLLFGGIGILLGFMGPDWVSLVIGGAVAGVGFVERRGGERLRRADPEAPGLLARNELVLMAVLVVFGVLLLTLLRSTSEELDKAVGGSLPGVDIEELSNAMTNVVGATTIAVALLYQGGMARYFLRRRRDVERFLAEIPEWARDVVMQMAG